MCKGDLIENYSGQELRVEKIETEKLEIPVKVYNFEVDDFHTYYVGSDKLLVHNKCSLLPLKINFDSKQIGKKFGKHATDYSMKTYQEYIDYAKKIFLEPEKIIRDVDEGEIYYIKGKDLLRVKESGDFISLYPGADSSKVINAINKGGIVWQQH